MSQHDYNLADQVGASFRSDLNNVLSAIVGLNSGPNSPPTTFSFMWWADTTNNVLKVRNSANTSWLVVMDLVTGKPLSKVDLLGSVVGSDTITANTNPIITAYESGQWFSFLAAGNNTGPTTININSIGAKNIYKNGTVPLESGDIISGSLISIMYDGTNFQFTSGAGSSSGAKAGGVIYENSLNITSNYTLTNGKNAMSVGPVSIADGVSVTVPSGARWVIL